MIIRDWWIVYIWHSLTVQGYCTRKLYKDNFIRHLWWFIVVPVVFMKIDTEGTWKLSWMGDNLGVYMYIHELQKWNFTKLYGCMDEFIVFKELLYSLKE